MILPVGVKAFLFCLSGDCLSKVRSRHDDWTVTVIWNILPAGTLLIGSVHDAEGYTQERGGAAPPRDLFNCLEI